MGHIVNLRQVRKARDRVQLADEGNRAGQRRRAGYRALLAQPPVAADPLAAATLRLLIAAPAYRTSAEPQALALLGEVADGAALPANHPLKTYALLQRANLAAASGDLATAAQSFERTGLTEQQCALIGVRPAMRRTGGSASDFPQEAQRMGFEGWVRTEFDIAASGTTQAQRALIAYPPFVFNDAAMKVLAQARFERSYRPETGVACTANRQNVTFRLP